MISVWFADSIKPADLTVGYSVYHSISTHILIISISIITVYNLTLWSPLMKWVLLMLKFQIEIIGYANISPFSKTMDRKDYYNRDQGYRLHNKPIRLCYDNKKESSINQSPSDLEKY